MAKRTNKPAKLKAPKGDPAKWPDAEKGSDTVKMPAAQRQDLDGPGATTGPALSDALPQHIRSKLASAMAEERLEQDLFTSGPGSITASVVFTANVVRDLDFLCGWFQNRYGGRGKVNRSGVLRLAIRCLRFELDPRAYGRTPELPGIAGAEGSEGGNGKGGR